MNQPNIYGVASFVAECLALFPLFVLIPFWFQAFSKLPLRCPPGDIYSNVTLPYLIKIGTANGAASNAYLTASYVLVRVRVTQLYPPARAVEL